MSTEVVLEPITDSEVGAVAAFLSEHLNSAVPAETWVRGMEAPWAAGPDFGFLLRSGGRIVGAALAFRSLRARAGRDAKICNLGALCVLEEHRAHTVRLIRAILKARDTNFTDLSPSGNVIEINRRLKMKQFAGGTRLLPNLPTVPRAEITVETTDTAIRHALDGANLDIYLDHVTAPAVRHLLLTYHGEPCHIMVRSDRRKGFRAFATVLYVSDREIFRLGSRQVLCHLLLNERLPFTLLEDRVAAARSVGVSLKSPRPRMYRSSTLTESEIDYLYSELTQIPW